MDLGNKLLELRKKKGISQEEAADILGVSRQTVSKWETGLSTPEFDKIKSIADLYEVSINELVTGIKEEAKENKLLMAKHRTKSAWLLVGAIFLYFAAISFVCLADEISLPDGVLVSIFLLICAVATCMIVFRAIMFNHDKPKKISNNSKKETKIKENSTYKIVERIITLVTLIIYLTISFMTMAWHMTWIMWVIYAVVCEIVKLIFTLCGKEVETDE